ncbi:DUF6879 family protein [Streptosporangium algeriense]|uniref:DUF6879 family protein n=1 Tax=Streptosporangium algeriense TaxID=1682748 RepID=A0ABW3DQ99_9ACTN
MLSEAELGALLANFKREAFRFELRDRYNSTVGREPYRRWVAGEPDDYAWHQGWLEKVRADRAAGKSWRRVRIVSVPVSDYTRYGIHIGQLNVEAGEDIRYLSRAAAEQLGLEPLDAWLLDETRLVRLHFHDVDDTFTGAELVADPEVVSRHLAWRDLAWQHAQPLETFAATL